PETFGGVLIVCAIWLMVKQSFGRRAFAGFLVGLSSLLKPTLGLCGVFLFRWAVVDDLPRGGRVTMRRAIAALVPLALGGIPPVAACLGWCGVRCPLACFYDVLVVFNREHLSGSWSDKTIPGAAYVTLVDWAT